MLCFACCIAIAETYLYKEKVCNLSSFSEKAKKHPTAKYKEMCRTDRPLQRVKAEFIHDMAGLPLDQPVSLSDMHKFKELLGFQVLVFWAQHKNEIVYTGLIESERKVCVYWTSLKMAERRKGNDTGHFLLYHLCKWLCCQILLLF